ncbi:DUF3979 family protein, partial [Escherichia sp. R-CC3]
MIRIAKIPLKCVELYFNEYDEVKITLYKDGIPITTMQRIAISKV